MSEVTNVFKDNESGPSKKEYTELWRQLITQFGVVQTWSAEREAKWSQ